MDTLFVKVAGATYNNRQAYLSRLRGDEPCRIDPEPDNPYDKNALAVRCVSTDGVVHLGYVPRDLAAQIAPLLEGEALMVTIDAITGGFELEDGSLANLGLVLKVEVPSADDDVYSSEDQSIPF